MQYGPRVWAFKVVGCCAHNVDLRLSRVKSVASWPTGLRFSGRFRAVSWRLEQLSQMFERSQVGWNRLSWRPH